MIMLKRITLAIVVLIALVWALISGGVVYVWQIKEEASKDQRISSLQANNAERAQQVTDLSRKLSSANQAIAHLSAGNSFTPGTACQSQQLDLVVEKSLGGAAGSTGEIFSYQNMSNVACFLEGYPGFLALDSTGHVMPNGPVKTANAGSNTTPPKIDLLPQAKAYFIAYWPAHDAAGQQNGCIDTALLESTPPGNLTPLVMVTSLAPMCDTPTVSALGRLNDFQ